MKPRYRQDKVTGAWHEVAEAYYLYRVPGVPATGSRLKRLLCWHDWVLKFNRGVESELECAKCGKSEVRKLAHMY